MSEEYKNHLFALVLAGGGGTRLWPRSRNKTPKQFLKLFGKDTLTQITIKRLRKILPWKNIYCITVSEDYKKEILKEIPKFISDNIIVEPARRDTGPAHAIGAAYIYKKDNDAVLITESADRLAKPVEEYLKTLQAAAKLAYNNEVLVSIGVKPRYPHTGLGHIKRGEKVSVENGKIFYKVDKFVEKPPIALAKKYTKSGKYYWNAGQFVWKAENIIKAVADHAPEIKSNLDDISEKIGTNEEKSQLVRSYKKMPKISIDYAVIENATNMLVVDGGFDWTDIGDWNEVWKNLKKDKDNNVIIDGDEPGGEIINIDSNDSLIHKDGRLIALIDVDDIVIVDMKDVLLVCSKSKSQNVKKIVNKLKEESREELL